MMTQLERLIPCASFIDWRRKQLPSPEESNNKQAILALEFLTDQLSALNGTSLHRRLVRLWEAEEDQSGERDIFTEIVGEELCAVGFTSFPATGKELLEKIVYHLESDSRQRASSS